jgi:hypothetical protein
MHSRTEKKRSNEQFEDQIIFWLSNFVCDLCYNQKNFISRLLSMENMKNRKQKIYFTDINT